MNDFVFAIDVGSSTIKGVVAISSQEGERTRIVAASSVPCGGMRRGEVVDSGQVVKSIGQLLQNIRGSVDVQLSKAVINIGGSHVGVVQTRGVVTVSRADQMISEHDVDRVITSSQAVSLPLNREIIHVIPKEFIVDGEGGVKNAVGMNGVRLELDALIVYAFSPHMKALVRALSEAGLGVSGTVVSGLAASSAILSEKEKEIGSVLIDIGAQTTDMVVFEEGQPIHVAVFPIGSFHVSNDIAIGLRIDFDIAEQLKIQYGHCDSETISRRDIITSEMLHASGNISITRRELVHIIEARIAEIFDLVNKELHKIGKESLLPGGATLIGGGSKAAGIVDFAKKELRLACRNGQFENNIEGLVGRIDGALFANAVGLAKWGLETNEGAKIMDTSLVRNIKEKAKNIFRNFLP